MKNIARSIIKQLQDYYRITGIKLTIGTAESATGGRVGDKITNISGSSAYYKGSIVAYSNEIKMRILGVNTNTLEQKGAVSAEAAIEMALKGTKALDVDICISDTGIAGPTGNTQGKPLGLFFFGLAAYDTQITEKHIFPYNRKQNKEHAAEMALTLLEKYLQTRLAKLRKGKFNEHHVVTSFLIHKGKILILKRSKKVGTYHGQWSGVSGYMETDELTQAITEIIEETGFQENDIKLINRADPISIIDESINRKWIIHAFLFSIENPEKLVTDWENVEFRWVNPAELQNYKTVPGLVSALNKVLLI